LLLILKRLQLVLKVLLTLHSLLLLLLPRLLLHLGLLGQG
jgi:hypothetical protein